MESDDELVKRLKNEFPEQFMSLVKMHLSFCLDQCTDEVDCLTPHTKSNDKRSLIPGHKRNRFSKQASHEEGIKYATQIYQLVDFLSKPSSLVQEGIFRRNGKVKQQIELMNLIKEKSESEIAELLDSNLYSVHEVATVLKNILAEMPEPLLLESYYPLHCSLADLNHPQRQVRGCQILMLLLPQENATMIRRILNLLHEVTIHTKSNKMNALNLGIVLSPHILCPRKMSAEDLTTNASTLALVVSFMIENAPNLFNYPTEFMDDVRLHYKRDPEEDASSTSSTPPVKTTITFVDRYKQAARKLREMIRKGAKKIQLYLREMTAKLVADGDPTEAALAELYAFVQSQPESEVKKKWVHKFNKENGCGTPKVILNSSITEACAKNCKNISHSIRKHLFNGTGVTPKRRRSKSSGRSSALCYTSETSPTDSLDIVDDFKSPKLKPARPQFGSQRNLLESTPVSDFIRHPAYTPKPSFRSSAATNPSSLASAIPSELAKETSNRHQEQVISPLTQSAQRFPYFVRDSIMTPRCRKPVFTFSPIDEPADDLVPNSDAIQIANLNLIQPQQQQQQTDNQEKAQEEEEEAGSSDHELSSTSSPSSSSSLSADDSDSFLSGCALIERGGSSLTSPFKSYLMSRDMQVYESDNDEEDSLSCSDEDGDLVDSDDQKISNSMLEFLDGNAEAAAAELENLPHLSPSSRPSPPLTKSILFETSL